MDHFVLIGSRKLGTSLDLVDRALQRGLSACVIVDPEEDFTGVFSPAVEVVGLSPDLDIVSEWLNRRFGGDLNNTFIANAYSPYTLVAARTAATFRRPGPDCIAIEKVEGKGAQRDLLSACGLATVPYARLRSSRSTSTSWRADIQTYPVVVKPDSGTGARGVTRCDDAAEVERYLQSRADDGDIVIEAMVEGEELCVEVFHGVFVGALRKVRDTGGRFLERAYTSDLGLSAEEVSLLACTVEKLCAFAGIVWGPVHLDVIWSRGKPFVIDINPRIAGSFITEMVADSYSVDIVGMLLDLACGSVPSPHRGGLPLRYCRIDFILEDSDQSGWHNISGAFENSEVKVSYGPMVVLMRRRVGYTYFRRK